MPRFGWGGDVFAFVFRWKKAEGFVWLRGWAVLGAGGEARLAKICKWGKS